MTFSRITARVISHSTLLLPLGRNDMYDITHMIIYNYINKILNIWVIINFLKKSSLRIIFLPFFVETYQNLFSSLYNIFLLSNIAWLIIVWKTLSWNYSGRTSVQSIKIKTVKKFSSGRTITFYWSCGSLYISIYPLWSSFVSSGRISGTLYFEAKEIRERETDRKIFNTTWKE